MIPYPGNRRGVPSVKTLGIGGLKAALQKLAVFRYPTADSLSPHGETGGLQLPTHDIDHLPFHEAGAFPDLLKAGPILPGKPDH